MVDALLEPIADPVGSFTANGGHDQERAAQAVAELHPDATIIGLSRAGGVASASTGQYNRVRIDPLRCRAYWTETTRLGLAVAALNRLLALGRPN